MAGKLVCPLCGSINTIKEITVMIHDLFVHDDGNILRCNELVVDDSKTQWMCYSCMRKVDPEHTANVSIRSGDDE